MSKLAELEPQQHPKVVKARNYAVNRHKAVNQYYGDKPYDFHLKKVADNVLRFKDNLEDFEQVLNAMCAAWCHDIIEDARETYNDVNKVLDKEVAELVYRLTNEKGRTRAERANKKYYDGLNEKPVAKFVKLCDIIANTTFSSQAKGNMYMKYKSELPKYKEHMYEPGQFQELWEHLENL